MPAQPLRSYDPLVLVADDEYDTREMYAQYLRHKGFRVITVDNAEDAVEHARDFRPDVIVMDLWMPRVDGFEATRRIRAHRRTAKIPVLAVTGHSDPFSPRRALESGCDEFLLKPVLPEDLESVIRRVLK